MATINDTNERNISTVRTTPYGIRSGSSSQMEHQTSKVQKKAASTIREGLGTQAVGTEELSASAIDNLNAVTAMTLNPYSPERQEKRQSALREDRQQEAAAQNWLSTFEQTIAPYVKLSDAERSYYDRMSRVYIERDMDPASFAEDFLTANAIANATGMSRSEVVTYADQLSDYFLGVPAERNMTWGRNIINSWNQGQRQQQMFQLQDEYRQLFAESRNDDDPLVQRKLAEIQRLQEEIDYNTDATPHNWLVNWISDGVAQVPYMLSGLGAGVVGTGIGAAIGSMIPVVGTKIGATVGNYLGRFISYKGGFSGNSFYEMKQAGISDATALRLSDAEGIINALNESMLDAVSDTLVGAIGGNAVKTVLYPGIFKKLVTKGSIHNFAGQVALYMAGQGAGEFIQEATQSLTTSAFVYAAEVMDNIPHTKTTMQALSDALEEGVAGFAVGLLFGLPGAVAATTADVRTSTKLFDKAVAMPSREAFINSAENVDAVKGMRLAGEHFSDADARSELGRMWDNAAEARLNRLKARSEVAGDNVTTKEGKRYAKRQLSPERLDGRLRSQTTVDYADDSQRTAELKIVYGGTTPTSADSGAPYYGTVRMTVDHAQHTASIDSISIQPGYEAQAQEMVRQAIQDNAPGYEVSWDTDVDMEVAIRDALVRSNPAGTEAGLTYSANTATGREAEIAEYSSRIRNSFQNLSDAQVNAAVHVLDTLAQHHGMSISELEQQYAGGDFFIHSDPSVAQRARGKRGAYRPLSMEQIAQGVKGVIYAGENADTSTFIHELFHFAADIDETGRKELSRAVKRMASENASSLRQFIDEHQEIFGPRQADDLIQLFSSLDENSDWNTELNEAMTSLYEAWMANHDDANLTPEVRSVLQKIADFMKQIYRSIKGNAKLDADVQTGFERIMGFDGGRMINSASQTMAATEEDSLFQSDKSEDNQREFELTEKRLRANPANFDEQGRHLAPNEKPSKLSYRLWVMVRTPSFKRWFGDWEKASRLRMLLSDEPTDISADSTDADGARDVYKSIGIVVNKETGMAVEFVNSTFGKIERHRGYDPRFIGQLHHLFENSMLMSEEAPDFNTPRADGSRHKDQSSNVIGYTHFLNAFRMDGEDYLVRYTVRNHRTRKPEGLHQFHSQYVSEIKISSLSTETALSVRGAELAASDKKLSAFLQDVNKNVSKVVDENGEPLIVYHGTANEFTVFKRAFLGSSTDANSARIGFFFTDSHRTAEGYGRYASQSEARQLYKRVRELERQGRWDEANQIEMQVEELALNGGSEGIIMPVFLDIRKPYEVDAYGANFKNVDGLFAGFEKGRHDGVIVYDLNDNIDDDYTANHYVALESNQIKSIDNTGAFDPDNPDILFQSSDGRTKITNNLFVTHTLSDSNLRASVDIGGLVMPSLGITKPETALFNHLKGYGNITLIGTSELGRQLVREGVVYNRDMWSPVFPRPEYTPNKRKLDAFINRLNKYAISDRRLLSSVDAYSEYQYANPDDFAVRLDGDNAHMAYAAEKGIPYETVYTHMPTDSYTSNFIVKAKAWLDENRERLNTTGYDTAFEDDMWNALRPYMEESFRERFGEDFTQRELAKANGEAPSLFSKLDPRKAAERNSREIWDKVLLDENLGYRKKDMYSLMRLAESYDPDALIVDEKNTMQNLSRALKGHDVRAWVREQIADAYSEPFLRIGRQKYPVTAENILRYMMKQNLTGNSGFIGTLSSAASNSARSLNTIQALHDAENLLGLKGEGLDDEYMALVRKYLDIDNSFEAMDGMVDIIGNYLKKTSSLNKPVMRRLIMNDQWLVKRTNESADAFADFAEKLRNETRPYFEAKPKRIMQLSDFTAAVVSDTVSDEARKLLTDEGLYVIESSRDNFSQDVIDYVQQNADVLLFQDDYDRRRFTGNFSRAINLTKDDFEIIDEQDNEEAYQSYLDSMTEEDGEPFELDESMSASNVSSLRSESEIRAWNESSWWIDENGDPITSEGEYRTYVDRYVRPLLKGRFANLFHHDEEQSIGEMISAMKPTIVLDGRTDTARDRQFIEALKDEETFRRVFGLLGEAYYLNTTATNAQRVEKRKKINGRMRTTQEVEASPYVDQREREQLQRKLQAIMDNPVVISVMRQALLNEPFSTSSRSTKSRAMKAIEQDVRLYRNLIANVLSMDELRPESLTDDKTVALPSREEMDVMPLSQVKTLLANNRIDAILGSVQSDSSNPEGYSTLADVALLLKSRLAEANDIIEKLKGKDEELSTALEDRDDVFSSVERWLDAVASMLGISNRSASMARKNEINSILFDLNGEKRYQTEATAKGARDKGKAAGARVGTREWLKDMATFYPTLKPSSWSSSRDYEAQLRANIDAWRQELLAEYKAITPENVNYLVGQIRQAVQKQNDELSTIKGSLSKLLVEASETLTLAKRSKIDTESQTTSDGFTIGDTENGAETDVEEEAAVDSEEPIDETTGVPRLTGSEDSKDSQLVEALKDDRTMREVMKRYGAHQQQRIDSSQAYSDETEASASRWAEGNIADEDMENFRAEVTASPRLYRRQFATILGRPDMAVRQQGGLPAIDVPETDGNSTGARTRRTTARQAEGIDEATRQAMINGDETLEGNTERQLKIIGEAIREIRNQIARDQRKIDNRNEKIASLRSDIADRNRKIRSLDNRMRRMDEQDAETIGSLEQELKDLRAVVHDLEIQMAAEERHAETEKRNLEARNAKLKERQQEEREYRKLRDYKMKLARSIFRKWTRSVDFRTVAPMMQYIRQALDPAFRRDWAQDPITGTGTLDINELRELYAGVDAGEITDIDRDELKARLGARLYNRISGEGARPLNDWTVEELEQLKDRLDEVWTEGRLIQKAKDEAKRSRRRSLRDEILTSVKSNPKYRDEPELTGTTESTKRKRSLKTEWQGNYYATKRMQELTYYIDGGNGQRGTAYDLLVERVRTMLDDEYRNEQRRMKPYEEALKTYREWLKDNGIKEDADEILFHKQYEVDLGDRTVHYNLSALAYIYLSQFNQKARDAVAYGSLISPQEKGHISADDADSRVVDFGGVNQHLIGDDEIEGIGTMRYKAALERATAVLNETGAMPIVEAVRDDLWNRDNAQRLFDFSLDVFNQPVVLEDHYLFVHRLDAQGNRPETIKDFNMAAGQALESIEKGFLEEKRTIAPANQMPANLDLFGGWVESMQQQEHLLAGGRLLSDLRATFETNREVMDVIRRAFGDGMAAELRDYIAHVADPHYSDVRNDVSRVINFLRGSVSTAYLGFKLSSIFVQIPTSLAPFLGSVKTGSMLKSSIQMMAHPVRTWNFITERSVRMERRTPTIMLEEIQKEARKQGKGKLARTWARFNEVGMSGLEWVDKMTVGTGWLAKYYDVLDKNIAEGMDTETAETAAIKAADDLVYEIQPVSDKTEVARLFRSSNALLKMFLQFQQAMNVVYNNVTTDTHQQWAGRKTDKDAIGRIVGRLVGYAGAGIILGLVQQGFDDDDDDLDRLGKLAYWGVSQGVDSIPVVGSIASGLTSAILTGQFDSYTMEENILPFASDFGSYTARLVTALRSDDGPDAQRALSAMEGIALSLGTAIGAPTSTIKQIIRSIEQESFMPMLGRY